MTYDEFIGYIILGMVPVVGVLLGIILIQLPADLKGLAGLGILCVTSFMTGFGVALKGQEDGWVVGWTKMR